ncbi:MAG TPA: Na+/H+ antiporter subunit E [Oligoflexia bacterium]|nr:Na+/H+ antiporter subunit E [Oligoflexia bacterium]HMR24724.1 Na+/H+ antiporter subunit E [Oligoflexia bacterium]
MFTFLTLFGFWLTLSQKFDLLHVSEGFILSAIVSFITLKYIFPKSQRVPFSLIKSFAFVRYCLWLIWQVVDSNLKMIPVILKPIMPINPRVIKFDQSLPHVFAQLTLANSITLTPGTITLDIENDTFVIHALTNDAVNSLLPQGLQGEMQERVEQLFAVSGSEKRLA